MSPTSIENTSTETDTNTVTARHGRGVRRKKSRNVLGSEGSGMEGGGEGSRSGITWYHHFTSEVPRQARPSKSSGWWWEGDKEEGQGRAAIYKKAKLVVVVRVLHSAHRPLPAPHQSQVRRPLSSIAAVHRETIYQFIVLSRKIGVPITGRRSRIPGLNGSSAAAEGAGALCSAKPRRESAA